MGGAMKYFLEKLLGLEIFRSMVSWATNIFRKFVKPPPDPPALPPPYILNDLGKLYLILQNYIFK